MTSGNGEKPYDLEDRTYAFAREVRALVKRLRLTIANQEDIRQLVRASGSVGSNYIEANESLGKKDFLMHIKISRKESKESRFFLRLLDVETAMDGDRRKLAQEALELACIFGAILKRVGGGSES
jgi:four helix bundle protein